MHNLFGALHLSTIFLDDLSTLHTINAEPAEIAHEFGVMYTPERRVIDTTQRARHVWGDVLETLHRILRFATFFGHPASIENDAAVYIS